MALDMSDIVLDNDLGQNGPINVQRRTRTVSDQGLTTYGPMFAVLGVYGVIVPASGRQLQRLKEADRTSSGIAAYTNLPLSVGGLIYAPDVIIYEGNAYLAQYVDDFTQYGFTGTVFTMTDMIGPDFTGMDGQ